MATRTIKSVTVYWDMQNPTNAGWAYRASDDAGCIDSGGIEADDLDEAIELAISVLDLDIDAEQFDREPHIDGGYATWEAE